MLEMHQISCVKFITHFPFAICHFLQNYPASTFTSPVAIAWIQLINDEIYAFVPNTQIIKTSIVLLLTIS